MSPFHIGPTSRYTRFMVYLSKSGRKRGQHGRPQRGIWARKPLVRGILLKVALLTETLLLGGQISEPSHNPLMLWCFGRFGWQNLIYYKTWVQPSHSVYYFSTFEIDIILPEDRGVGGNIPDRKQEMKNAADKLGEDLEKQMAYAQETGEYKGCVILATREMLMRRGIDPDAMRSAASRWWLPDDDAKDEIKARTNSYLQYIYGSRYGVEPTNLTYQIQLTVSNIIADAYMQGIPLNEVTNEDIDRLYVTYLYEREAYAEGVSALMTTVTFATVEKYWAEKTANSAIASKVEGTQGKGGSKSGSTTTRVFTSKDPLVGDVTTQIEQSIPGRVTSVNKVVYRPDGSILTDLDIELGNIVIQVKTGGGKGLTKQMVNSANSTGKIAIGYVPDVKPSILKEATNNGFKVFTNMDDLIEFISQN